ncbi:hypothetical protein BDY24DRAFT_437898 [Mrakia frigida]|uniref:uncharacterized protein n=1 Tax=Mrakia frigida TaxID=29902 RepID=UPI003FCBFC74
MDLILSRITLLEEQARLQAATIANLSLQNTTLASTVSLLSSTVARLSSREESHDAFHRQVEVKLFPDGFWIWEKSAKEAGEGVWVWSNDKHRKPSPTVKVGRTSSLASLPTELLETILSLATFTQHARLQVLRVCFRFLEILGPVIYRRVCIEGSESAMLFVLPRISNPSPSTARVSALLIPHHLLLRDHPDDVPPSSLPALTSERLPDPSLIVVANLKTESVVDSPEDFLLFWSPILRLLNPIAFTLVDARTRDQIPTSRWLKPVGVKMMPFLSKWNLLRSVTSVGPHSSLYVRLSEEEEDASVFQDSFERSSDGSVPELEMWWKTVNRDGTVEHELLDGMGLSRMLPEGEPPYFDELPGEPWMVTALLKRKEDPNDWE